MSEWFKSNEFAWMIIRDFFILVGGLALICAFIGLSFYGLYQLIIN